METWVVTGASGLLGSNIAITLKDKYRLVGVSRSIPKKGLFAAHYSLDVRDALKMREVVASENPVGIINAAALADHGACAAEPALARDLNTQVPRDLAEIAGEVNARLIHISTDAVFGGQEGNYREIDSPNPFSVYGETKLAGDMEVLATNSTSIIARTNFFGWSPSGDRSILEFFVNALRDAKEVSGYSSYIVSSIYAPDLVRILEVVGIKGETEGLVHIGSATPESKLDFGMTVAKCFGLDSHLIRRASSIASDVQSGPSLNLSLNCDLLTSLLKHAPPSTELGILRAREDEGRIKGRFRSEECN
jgi:dTDP-4-dehydrorhamnose reductase